MITRHELNKMDAVKRSVKKEAYKKIYEQFCRTIHAVATAGHKHAMLTVPPFLLGYPIYDVTQAAVYLKRQLTNGGFDVTFVYPSSLVVTWFPESKTPAVQESVSYSTPVLDDDTLPSLINLRKAANKYRS